VNALHNNLARSTPVSAPVQPTPQQASRRRRRQRESGQLSRCLCAVGLGAVVLVTYVFGCATAAHRNYQASHLRAQLGKLQSGRKLLEAQVADLQRLDRVLFLAKQQGMEPRKALRYVSLMPEPGTPRPVQQASAR